MPPYALGLRLGLLSVTALVAIFTGWAYSGVLALPLPNTLSRLTPLHFGLYVTPDPENNPIDPPERFTGFHVATDFEIFETELGADVPVYAICDGKIVYSGYAEGYGGLVIQRCSINREEATVLYGHMKLEGLPEEGTTIKSKTTIGLLADAYSYESGYNRKHLHLGIRKGKKLDFRGYVQREDDLQNYIDPMSVLPLLTPLEQE